MGGGSYRHSSSKRRQLGGLLRIHLPNRYTNGYPADVLVRIVLRHQGLPRVLLLLQRVEPLLLHLLL